MEKEYAKWSSCLIMRILITGPESSGKSTLSHQLSDHFSVPYLREHARTYLNKKSGQYTYPDLLKIAKAHFRLFQMHKNIKHLILDTFLINIKIWSLEKYGKCDPLISKMISKVNYDCILLTKPNIPWVNDPLRESPYNRDDLFQKFEEEMQKLEMSYYIIDGKKTVRFFKNKSFNITFSFYHKSLSWC